MGEKAAQIGDNALRRIGPAANGEATQFGEQGGRIGASTSTSTTSDTDSDSGSGNGAAAAAARGAAIVSFLGRHVHVRSGESARIESKLAKTFNCFRLELCKSSHTHGGRQAGTLAHSRTHTDRVCPHRIAYTVYTAHTLSRHSTRSWPEKVCSRNFSCVFSLVSF